MRNRTEPNRLIPEPAGTGRGTEPNRTEPDRATACPKNAGRSASNGENTFPNRNESHRIVPSCYHYDDDDCYHYHTDKTHMDGAQMCLSVNDRTEESRRLGASTRCALSHVLLAFSRVACTACLQYMQLAPRCGPGGAHDRKE